MASELFKFLPISATILVTIAAITGEFPVFTIVNKFSQSIAFGVALVVGMCGYAGWSSLLDGLKTSDGR